MKVLLFVQHGDALPHDQSCSVFFASDALTGEGLCNCGRIRP